MASSLPSIEGIANGARFNLCVGLQAGTLAASFAQALGVDAPDVGDAYPDLFEWACNIPPEDAPSPPQPPFTGGQCPTNYSASLTVSWTGGPSGPGTNSESSPGPFIGPISLVFVSGSRSYRLVQANGATALSRGFPLGATGVSVSASVSRLDGQPDNCGNPPFNPPIPPWPPGGAPVTGPITYRDEGDNIINVDGDFVFEAPRVTINNEVTVGFTVDVGVDNRSYRGTINLTTGGATINPTFILPGRGGGAADEPLVPPDPPTSTEPAEDDPEKELIRAVVVTFDVRGNRRATELFYANQPETFAPRLGVVRFAIAIPDSDELVWTADIPVKQSQQWIDCPSPYGAVDVIASPDPGSGNIVIQTVAIRGPCPCA